MTDLRQTSQYAKYMSLQGWIVERIDNTNYFIRKFSIFGSILKVQRPEKIDFKTIDELCRKHRTFQVILEPKLFALSGGFTGIHNQMLSHGFRLSKSPYLPTRTLQIDLRQPMSKIYANFTKDCRYSIRKASGPEGLRPGGGRGVFIKQYSTPDEIKIFHEAWKKTVNCSRYVPTVDSLINLRKTFPSNYSIFLASHNIIGSIIGGVIFTRSLHGVGYYWQAFTNSEGRTSLSQYPLLYQGILWAKRMGCKVFDFEGIYDPRFPNKSWLGFTHFKRSFGGIEVSYSGCYTKFRLPI